jgi:beta-D-xylosidase 4
VEEPAASLPFCDMTLSLETRVADYVSWVVPVERHIRILHHNASGYAPLHIPPYQWWSKGLHVPKESCVEYEGKCLCPTRFTCSSGLGSALNASLYHLIGLAIGQEGQAISNVRPHDSAIGDGLTYCSPTLNLQRNARWGRNQEGTTVMILRGIISFCQINAQVLASSISSYLISSHLLSIIFSLVPCEDPFLTGIYAKAFVQGLQGNTNDENGRIQVAAACKHFVANSLEDWQGHSRHNFGKSS